ncbi:MAG: Fe-S cluster assembly protein HesB [Methanomicrobiaceae archaeon]|uniref:Endonuclease iii n=1 Tax=hydrocarbon metagenome TaxID=938273 RepID=A0A0W8FDU9_9ZZZZ|nr:Fe-S cluster assembly protein HesB [Methanomicrobiaceae archaeon]MDD5419339.1 Fe-S cluster assembly protein HesB [Methanomicrobiaceae archaeon]
MSASVSSSISALIDGLFEQYGPLIWWKGSTEEVMIGAILTQQTRWENVEVALSRLRQAGICSIRGIFAAPMEEIEALIRPTGFFRVKARRLQGLAAHVIREFGGVEGMRTVPTEDLRESLLSVKGVGEETADSILCYGLGRAVFVIDAYTERICWCAGIDAGRRELKGLFESVLPETADACRQSHAHFVEYAKGYCGKKRCDECWIRNFDG